jgi:acyl-coenzyme A synthetase/AMP-(fatty) acid ligase
MSTPNFYQHVHHTLGQQAGQVLLQWPGVAEPAPGLTGQDLAGRIGAYQALLLSRGVRAAQPVLLALPVGPELICGLLAVMSLGAVPVLPPAGVSLTGLLALLRRGGIGAALVPARAARRYGWLTRALGLRLLGAPAAAATAEPLPPAAVAAELPALVSHSSGSTGRPKAIRRSHAVLSAQHAVLRQVFPPWAGQRDFPLFPNILLHNLAVGALTVLPDVPWGRLASFDPARVVQQLRAAQVETLTGNVFYFRRLLDYLRRQPQALPAVRAVGVGGSPVPEHLLAGLQQVLPQAAVYTIYGSSEAEPIAVRRFDAAQPLAPSAGYCVGPVVAGLECQLQGPGIEIRLSDGRQFRAGEVTVRGPHVAAPAGAWLRTGDFGYFDEQQRLWLTGRQGNETAHQGTQHYQLEHVLLHQPGVVRAAARSTPAGFSLYLEGEATPAAVLEAVQAQFPPGLCNQIHPRAHLPVDRRHLSKILYDQLR